MDITAAKVFFWILAIPSGVAMLWMIASIANSNTGHVPATSAQLIAAAVSVGLLLVASLVHNNDRLAAIQRKLDGERLVYVLNEKGGRAPAARVPKYDTMDVTEIVRQLRPELRQQGPALRAAAPDTDEIAESFQGYLAARDDILREQGDD